MAGSPLGRTGAEVPILLIGMLPAGPPLYPDGELTDAPEEQVAALSGRVKAIVVPELSLGQIIFEVDRCAKGRCGIEGIYRVDGRLVAEKMVSDVVRELRARRR